MPSQSCCALKHFQSVAATEKITTGVTLVDVFIDADRAVGNCFLVVFCHCSLVLAAIRINPSQSQSESAVRRIALSSVRRPLRRNR